MEHPLLFIDGVYFGGLEFAGESFACWPAADEIVTIDLPEGRFTYTVDETTSTVLVASGWRSYTVVCPD